MYNKHNSDIRVICEELSNDEMFVSWNGPELGECDEAVRKAVGLYFSAT